MSKREKIILFVMALTLIYGFYVFFLEDTSPPGVASLNPSARLDKFNKFITNVAEQTKGGLSDVDSFVIENLATKWKKDPLLNAAKDFRFDKDRPELANASSEQIGIKYSGFLQMGDIKMAIIDGQEYEQGDTLQPSGYTVGTIYPDRVIIIIRSGKYNVTVPLEENQ
jgi:hypothetical protein